jgi:hypothetical protein
VDSVVEYFADITREETSTTKMLLAELQDAIVARCLGYYQVRRVEGSAIKAHLNRMSANK